MSDTEVMNIYRIKKKMVYEKLDIKIGGWHWNCCLIGRVWMC
jgi:hypothetical protein